MVATNDDGNDRPAWFVGAGNQTERFVSGGIWETNGSPDLIDQVKFIKPGDRIAIHATYTRKLRRGLPFDNRGNHVSVMAIKAIGTVAENIGDGRNLKVDWTRVDPPREWYFHTGVGRTVWEVHSDNWGWMAEDLISFTFDNQEQDIDRFRNHPDWRDAYGDIETPSPPPESDTY